MRIVILIFITIYFAHCSSPEKTNLPEFEIKNDTLNKCLQEYRTLLNAKQHVIRVLTLDVEFYVDTTVIDLINSLPDSNLVKINAVAKYNDFVVYVVGAYPMKSFFIVSEPNGTYEIDKILKYEISKMNNLSFVEPLFWKLYFVNDKLLKSYRSNSMAK